ncbi:MAG: class II aldolase/adducin family protein [Helicobacteraceae bacterium]|nr:class II aldolase/adducin family protein [Helicobacteraceae bacterium]
MIHKNVNNNLLQELIDISLTMFRKNFFDIFHGAISMKIDDSKFVINTKDAVLNSPALKNYMVLTHKRNYSWQEASDDAFIHSFIYKEISEAKCIAYTFPNFTMAYSLNNNKFIPKDYFGYKKFKEAKIYNLGDYDSWYERADVEICNFLRQNKVNFVIVRGYGLYIYERELSQLAKTISMIENSAKILVLSDAFNKTQNSNILSSVDP